MALLCILLLACGDKDDSGLDCDTMAVASVQVTVQLEDPDAAGEVAVTAVDAAGSEVLCDAMPDAGTWVCGWERAGEITVTATASGHLPASATVTVAQGECHVETELMTLSLEKEEVPVLFETSRLYYVQLIPDPYECEHSWELYGMNCYMTADFCADGRAWVIITDIINHGTYALTQDGGGQDTVTAWLEEGDAPAEMTWDVVDDATLRDRTWGEDWLLDVDGLLMPSCG